MSVDPDLPAPAARPSPLVAAAVVGLGGAVGALARAGLADLWPHRADQWPWSTLVTNASGAALLGVLLAVLATRFPRDRFARPLLGTGLLGGYTTFSTLSVDAVQLVRFDRPGLALGYVAANLAAILVGCWLGLLLSRRALAGPDAGTAW
ncbi:MAG: CrcB family protein [Sporichthyaceae bacterium]